MKSNTKSKHTNKARKSPNGDMVVLCSFLYPEHGKQSDSRVTYVRRVLILEYADHNKICGDEMVRGEDFSSARTIKTFFKSKMANLEICTVKVEDILKHV